MPVFTPAQLADLRQLGGGMLDHMRRSLRGEKPPAADLRAMMNRLAGAYGIPGATIVVRYWIDTVIDLSPTIRRGDVQSIVFLDKQRTGFVDVDQLSPDTRWAARVILAAIAGDQVVFYRLVDQLPPNPSGHLIRTVEVCASMLNAYDSPDTRPGHIDVGQVLRIERDRVG